MPDLPSFFISTAGEFEGIREPRACFVIARANDDTRDDYLVVEVNPAIDGQRIGAGHPIRHLLLSSYFEGTNINSINEWPMYVYVARIVDPALLGGGHFHRGQIELLARGSVHPSREAAQAWANQIR